MLAKKRIISVILSFVMVIGMCATTFAAESISDATDVMQENYIEEVEEVKNINDSITIYFGEKTRSTGGNEFEADNVKTLFENNELNYDYYKNWLYSQDLSDLDSVTFSVSAVSDDIPEAIANSDIKGTRMVYVERHGILNPGKFFGSDTVIEEKDYYMRDGSYRTVTKFVELNAPVSGKTQWYAWGYAESDYVRIRAQLFYKGVTNKPEETTYTQYYPEHYYLHAQLINLTKQAYSNKKVYAEVPFPNSGAYDEYKILQRDINKDKYLEYDNLVAN